MSEELDKLDRLAAEKVMGWTVVNCAIVDSDDCYLFGTDDWQPTRNISQAWECLEKIRKISPDFHLGIYEDRYLMVFHVGEPDPKNLAYDDYTRNGSAETAPLAIVKACLKAKGIE